MRAHADFPACFEHDGTLTDPEAVTAWIRRDRKALLSNIEASGALLLRGLPLKSAEDFHRVVEAFDLGRFSYRESLSNAVRIDLTDRAFTANEAPPEATIRLHHELAQTPAHPRHLFFFCERAAASGGATALCRSDQLYERLIEAHPDFMRAASEHGLVYHHVMPGEDDPGSSMGRSWRSTLDAVSREDAERKLAALGYTFEWRRDDELAVTTPCLPAVLELPDGRRSFFNQIVATRSWRDIRNSPERVLRLGNGQPISLDLRDAIASLTESLAIDLLWQRGDLAVLDNHRVQHGRRPFQGDRKVLVAFGARA